MLLSASSQRVEDFPESDEPDPKTGDFEGDEDRLREHSDNRIWLVRTRPWPGGWPPSGRGSGRTGGRPAVKTLLKVS